MFPIDSLTLFAEIAVALAGFAGVILALRGRRPEEGTLEYARLFRLLETSFACAFFSILPQVLSHTGLSSSGLWHVSGACLTLYMFVIQTYLIWRFWRILRAPPPGASWRGVVLLTGGYLTFAVGLAFSLLGHFPIVSAYLAALAFHLFAAGYMFVRLILRG